VDRTIIPLRVLLGQAITSALEMVRGFGPRDPEVTVGLLKAKGRFAGPGSCELERPTRNVADP
jgi:hypothetical protein